MHKMTKHYTPQVSTPYRTEDLELEQKTIEIDRIGFSDKTMWDWLILFSTLAIPLVVLCATIVFSIQQEKANEAQHSNELRIADAQEEETTLSAYLDGLTSLLLDKKLGSPEAAYDASVVARAKTMIVLQRLNDPQRKSMVVQFLYDAHLIIGKQPRVSLDGVDLSGVDLSSVDLRGANLSGAHLNIALLRSTDLRDAILSDADMQGADMKGTDLRGANMTDTRLTNDQLQQIKR